MFSQRGDGSETNKKRLFGKRSRERRQHRSYQLFEALRLQMHHTQQRLSLDALVLCDDLGEILASAGRSELVSEVAVQSPWLAASSALDLNEALSYLWKIYPGLKSDRVCVQQLELDGVEDPLILCGIGHSKKLDAGISQVVSGVERILRSAVN